MMKKILICSFLYVPCVVATSYVEPIYSLNIADSTCIYKSVEGERTCKFCDSPESFRIIPIFSIEDGLLDEKLCPQRELNCHQTEYGTICWSKLKESK